MRESGIDLVQNVLAVVQRPHLADGLVADPGYDAADLVQHRFNRRTFGVPIGLRARQLEGEGADLASTALVAQRVGKSWIMLHVIDAGSHIDQRPEHRMRGYVFDALAVDPDLAAIADRIAVLFSRAYHRRSHRSWFCGPYSCAAPDACQPAEHE